MTNCGSRPRTRRRAVNQLMPVGYSYHEAGQSERALYSGRLYPSGGSGITRLNHFPPRKCLAPILEKIHLDNNYIAQSAKGWMSNESLAQWMRDSPIPTVKQIRSNNKDRHALVIPVSS